MEEANLSVRGQSDTMDREGDTVSRHTRSTREVDGVNDSLGGYGKLTTVSTSQWVGQVMQR